MEEAYQRGVNKEHKPNPARMHPMSSQQGKGCQEMPITQTEPVQYSHDSQSDSDQDFDVMTVNPNAESMRMDSANSCPQDGHVQHHAKLKANSIYHPIHHPSPTRKLKYLFLDYIQILMIGQAGRWTQTPSTTPLKPKKK